MPLHTTSANKEHNQIILDKTQSNLLKMPEVRLQRLSATKSQRLSSSLIDEINSVEQIITAEPKGKRSKSKDPAKASKVSKKKSLSPEKSTRRSRTKSKSPARSASRSRKEGKDKTKTSTTSPKQVKGAKLYTKKDLVQEIAPEIPQKRVLRSSSSMSSKTDLKEIAKSEPIQEQTIESIKPALTESVDVKNTEPNASSAKCSEVFIDLGYMRVSRCVLMKIVMISFLLMIVLTMINHYDSNKDHYHERMGIYVNSIKKCVEGSKQKLIALKSKFF